ncbi:MAG: hypothetical protein Q4E53_04435 [Eubacteriales bacterium]|nr:hypothetical protein [Eubacteriales bacterium]
MIDFTLELKKFKPAVGVEDLFDNDIKDITDLVEEMVNNMQEKQDK